MLLSVPVASRYLRLAPDDPFVQTAEFRQLEDDLYSHLKTSGGTWKTTTHHRLDALNAALFEVVESSAFRPEVVIDIAISSGASTLEWLNEFNQRGYDIKLIGTDLTMTVYIARLSPVVAMVIERSAHVLQIELLGRGYLSECGRRDWVSGFCFFKAILVALLRLRLWSRGISQPISLEAARRNPDVLEGPFLCVSPLLRNNRAVLLIDDDILAPNDPTLLRRADIIRLANILQPSYFAPDQIRTAVENVRDRCRGEGSLVVVCRNDDQEINGSILRMSATRDFVTLKRIGLGSEIETYFVDDSVS